MCKYDEEGLIIHSGITDSSRKNVFLIGDSIRMGYCKYTESELAAVADLKYPSENCRNTQYTYINLSWWKNIYEDTSKVDLVYWNNGHWDIAHWDGDDASLNSIEQYCDMLVRIYRRLRNLFPNAKIVFATTTPCNPNGATGPNPRSNTEISAYNDSAKAALGECDVIIHDLFELLSDKDESIYSDYCHLTEEGFRLLGKEIAGFINELL